MFLALTNYQLNKAIMLLKFLSCKQENASLII